jgi:predicted transposase YbfD/YdcC
MERSSSGASCKWRRLVSTLTTDAKSNEITAVPKLLEMLTLKGAIVTADALNCQRSIAGQIVEQEGDYALALKGNQGTLYDDVRLLLDDPESKASTGAPVVEGDHGRVETRTATVSTEIGWLQKQHQWPGLAAIGKVERIRETPEKTSAETAYYLLSTALSPGAIQRSRPPALGRGESAALATGCGHERGSGSNQDGKRPAQSRRAQAHGSECDAEGRIERLNAREVQTRRLGRGLPDQTLGDVLKCDCPASFALLYCVAQTLTMEQSG